MPYIIKNGIAYAGNAVTITQAQYDALSEAEKKNGTVYYIYDSDEVLDANDVKYGSTNVGSALDTLNNSLTFQAGDSIRLQFGAMGRSVSAKNGVFLDCTLPKSARGRTVTVTYMSNYGMWFSDGNSHSVTASDPIVCSIVSYNHVWFTLPVSGITDASTVAWFRLDLTISFS